jgi:hypothetical protein
MVTLANYPIVSQLTGITSNQQPSENDQFDCVAATLGSMVLYYRKKTQWDATLNPDMLKDSAYGQGFVGGTSAINYTSVLNHLGFKLYAIEATGAQLVASIHDQIKKGIPCAITEPDPYARPELGWSHVCAAFGEDSSGHSIRRMDPYIAKFIDDPDSWYVNNLQFNQIWCIEPKGGHMTGVPTGWKDDGTTLTAPNGVHVVKGFRDFILDNGWEADDWPLGPEYGAAPLEQSNPTLGTGSVVSGSRLDCRWKSLCWRSDKNMVYFSWNGVELDWYRKQHAKLAAQIVAMQKGQ